MRSFALGLMLAAGVAGQAVPPPNGPAALSVAAGQVTLTYDGVPILRGALTGGAGAAIRTSTETARGERDTVAEKIRLRGAGVGLEAEVAASPEAIAAETYGAAQRRFALIRTSSGPDHNRRNNAIYDRRYDWVLELPAGAVIEPEGAGRFHVRVGGGGDELVLRFQPRYYQKFRGLSFYEPWTYAVWPRPVAGWSSWWAYEDTVTEQDVRQVAQLFAAKLRDFGYQYIQLDDGYHPRDGDPAVWTATNAKFPGGLGGLAAYERGLGLKPAVWENIAVDRAELVAAHPAWFLRGPSPWIGYGIEGANAAALDALVRPTYRQLHAWGYDYVKVDTLRHLLYDAHSSPAAFRDLLGAIRQELGPQTYLLACWGVLPESVGIADGERLGTDGFGPATLQQYNSFNNIVWRNDPDHVDLAPGEEILRPVEVSMAGAQLMLSDRAEVYRDDARLEGAKRAAPVLVTAPGQLYDYDPRASDNLARGLRNADGGAQPGPVDAERGAGGAGVCPWWLMDISRPFGNWSVLARLGWKALPAATVRFKDLGLAPDRTYLVYEFWTRRFVGAFRGSFPAAAQPAKAARVYAIRAALDRPQVLSTSRHITQGGVDLDSVEWDGARGVLSGVSEVVAGDPYRIVMHVPPGWRLAGGRSSGEVTTLALQPTRTGPMAWSATFTARPGKSLTSR